MTKKRKNPRLKRGSEEQGILILENWVNKREAINEAEKLLRVIKNKFDRNKRNLEEAKSGDRIFYIVQKLEELDNLIK